MVRERSPQARTWSERPINHQLSGACARECEPSRLAMREKEKFTHD